MNVTRDGAGRYIADFGQNLPGWLRIAVDGPAGTCVRVRHGEVLTADGCLYTENLRTARQTDEFLTPAARRSWSPASPCTGSATPRSPAIPVNRARPTSWPAWSLRHPRHRLL